MGALVAGRTAIKGSKFASRITATRRAKSPVRAASTVNENIATLASGSVIDGVTLATNDRILLTAQTTASDNGIYVIGASAGQTVRSTDFDEDVEVFAGVSIFATEGTVHADTVWILATDDPIVVGTTALSFIKEPVSPHTHTKSDIADFLHLLGGAEHEADTFANLESKVSDGKLVKLVNPGTDILTAEITALPAGGGRIYLNKGTFVVDASNVTFDKSNVEIIGQGLSTILDITGASGATKGFDVGAFSSIRIADMKVKLNKAAGGLIGIDFAAGGGDSVVERVSFENTLGSNTAYIRTASPRCKFLNVFGNRVAGTIATGIAVLAGGADGRVFNSILAGDTNIGFACADERNIFLACQCLAATSKGFDLTAPNNIIEACGAVGSGAPPFGILISDKNHVIRCRVQDFDSGIQIGSECIVDVCIVSECTIGFKLNGNKNKVSGGRVTMPAGAVLADAVFVFAAKTKNSVVGVTIDGGANTSTSSDGIHCGGGTNFTQIVGNTLIDMPGDGVRLAGSLDCNVSGNHLSAIVGTEIIETGAADFNSIRANHLRGGTITTVGAGTVVEVNTI